MRLRSRKREPALSKRTNKVTKITKSPSKPVSRTPTTWKKVVKRDVKNVLSDPQICITRAQKLKNLKTRPVRTKSARMEKPVETHKGKAKHNDRTKKPIFQTVVRSTNKDSVSSTTLTKKQEKSKLKEVGKLPIRHSSLNRDVKISEVASAMNSPRKTRRLDKTEKAASLNSSPIRKVRQIGVSPKQTVSSTNESPKKKTRLDFKKSESEQSSPTWPGLEQTEDDVTMYEPHTTTFDFPTPKSEESDSDGHIETSELCLPNDCLNDFIPLPDVLPNGDDDINFLADKAARVMTTEREDHMSQGNSVDKRLAKRRKSSNDLEMYQPTSTTDDLDTCADFLVGGEKYVQVRKHTILLFIGITILALCVK